MQPNNITLYLPSILGYEKIARSAAEAMAQQMDFSPARIEDLKTAVAEACMNAIEHGNRLDQASVVTVVMAAAPDRLEVRVADSGQQPMPETLPTPAPTDTHGWGFFFIEQLVDEMEITRLEDGGNQVRMVIHLVQSSGESLEDALGMAAGSSLDTPAPGAIQPVEQRPSAVQTVEARPGAIQPAEDRPRAIQPAEERPRAVQPVEPRPGAIQPAEDRPRAIQPAAEAPASTRDAAPDSPSQES